MMKNAKIRKQEANVIQDALWLLLNTVCLHIDLEASVVLNWNSFIKWTSSYEDEKFISFKYIYLDNLFIIHILMIKVEANQK